MELQLLWMILYLMTLFVVILIALAIYILAISDNLLQ